MRRRELQDQAALMYALEGLLPATVVAGLSPAHLSALAYEAQKIGGFYNPLFVASLWAMAPDRPTLQSFNAALKTIPLNVMCTDDNGHPRLHDLFDSSIAAFAQTAVRQLIRTLPPGLELGNAQMQFISDSQAHPLLPEGLRAHTDNAPPWCNETRTVNCLSVTAVIATSSPGTVMCRLKKPAADFYRGQSMAAHLIKRTIRRQQGPTAAVFTRCTRAARVEMELIENTTGAVGLMTGTTIHWRSNHGRGKNKAPRLFIAFDLVFPITPRNRRLLRQAQQKHMKKPRLTNPRPAKPPTRLTRLSRTP